MLFSNMPPLEAAKILCSLLASKKTSKNGKLLKLALYDSRELISKVGVKDLSMWLYLKEMSLRGCAPCC